VKVSVIGKWAIGLSSVLVLLLGSPLFYNLTGLSQPQPDSVNALSPNSTAPGPNSTSSSPSRLMAATAFETRAVASLAAVPRVAVSPTEQPANLAATQASQADLAAFSRRVANGQPGALCGLYAAGVLALRVVQQPAGDAGFISKEDGTATQFQKVDGFDAVGLLAHNTLAGRDFFKLLQGQDLVLVYGDGRAAHYQVSEIADYQRLTLADLRSDFLSLDTHQQQTADQVFARYYQQAHRLTLQTCLRQGKVADWGVRFVVADPSQTAH
jgi:hypothetical protein